MVVREQLDISCANSLRRNTGHSPSVQMKAQASRCAHKSRFADKRPSYCYVWARRTSCKQEPYRIMTTIVVREARQSADIDAETRC